MAGGWLDSLIKKIISGGQTGADRAALDFAITRGIAHGGWCPNGRWAEDGRIPGQYQVIEAPSPDPVQRSEWNVRDSDGTAILSISQQLVRGSKKTEEFAARLGKPLIHISRQRDGSGAAKLLREFLRANRIEVLNVAGPRASEEPEVSDFVAEILGAVL
jgi:hypothetical protein